MKIKQELLLNDIKKKEEKNKDNIETEKNHEVKVNVKIDQNASNNNILNVNKYKRLHLPEINNSVNNINYIAPKINRLNLRVNNSNNYRNGNNNLYLYRQKYKLSINNSNNNSNNNLSEITKLYGLKQHKYPKYVINKENNSNNLKGINGLNLLYNIDYNNYRYQGENKQIYSKKLNPIVKKNYINIFK